jgi:hypothetical protein
LRFAPVDFRAELVLREVPALRAVVFFRPVLALRADIFFFRAPPALRVLLFFALEALRVVAFRDVVFLRAVVFFRPVDLRAVLFFFAVDFFLAVDFFAAVFFLAVDFLAEDFFFAVDFFAADFFLAVDFLADELRDPERALELRAPERDEDRVRAGITVGVSVLSSSVSPTADSPHVSSADSTDGSLHEPASGVSDASPVPLQSSWVINDLLRRIARARFPTTLLSNVQRGRTTSCARC